MDTLALHKIFIYPVKSLPGIALDSAVVEERGLAGDRRFMLVDPAGKFISLREKPRLYDFDVSIDGAHVVVRHPDDPEGIRFSPANTAAQQQVSLWDDAIAAYRLDRHYDEWFSTMLGDACSLVVLGDDSERLIDDPWGNGTGQVSFADGYPYLAVTQASLADISDRTGQPMDVRRFRPNIVIGTGEPHEELSWDEIRIGSSAILKGVKPCKRCVVTTIDPDTRAKSKEPLRSLAGLHKRPAALFGQNAKMLKPGTISVGDRVTVTKDPAIRLR